MINENYLPRVKKSVLGLTMAIMLIAQFSFAQTSITWTGAISSDASNAQNWDPQLTPDGNILYIDTASKFTNLPVWDVENSTSLNKIESTNLSQFSVNILNADSVIDVSSGSNSWYQGTLNVGGKGKISWRKSLYFENSDDTVKVTGGILEARVFLIMGKKTGTDANGDIVSDGGYMYVSGDGIVHVKNAGLFIRFCTTDSTKSVITVTDNGQLHIAGDWSATAAHLIARNQLISTVDREIVVEYNPTDNYTYVTSRSTNIFLTEQTDVQYATVNQEAQAINLVDNAASRKMTSIDWKYSTTSGSGYQSFDPALTNDTVSPIFSEQGVYYVICEGTYTGGTLVTDEIKYIVSSDKVHVTPDGMQTLKIKQPSYPLTVVEDEAATSREWLYTTTQGESYSAFDPAVTDTFCSPIFDAVGDYYVVCRSEIGGVEHQSAEVHFTVVDSSTYTDIRWNGSISEKASDIRNWTPHSHLYLANITLDTSEYDVDPVIETIGNDVLGSVNLPAGAILTVDKPEGDTVFMRSTDYIGGTLHIKNGIYKVKSYYHFKDTTSVLDIEGGEYIQSVAQLLLGGRYGEAGGMVYVHGTGSLYATGIGRFSTVDTTTSVITVWDEGKIVLAGDQEDNVAQWDSLNQLRTLPGWELDYRYYDEPIYQTIITAFDPTAITVTPKTQQILAIDSVAAVLSASNTGIYDSLIWKYSTTVGGELIAFEPAVNDTFAAPSFNAPGNYYVACVGMNDTLTKKSNSIHILVPDVTVSPSEKQVMKLKETSITLTVSESPSTNTRTWYVATEPGGSYEQLKSTSESFAPSASPFNETGTYYVICESEISGENNKSIWVRSNEVEVEVVDIEVSPSSAQDININEDGTTVTVTETGTVDSREWLVSKTSGSGYESFDPAETGTDYTPNFDAVGTYYVVCATIFSGVTIMSEEITINTDLSGLNDMDANTLAIYPNPTTGAFVINEEILTNYRVDVYNALGKLVLSDEFDGVNGAQELMLEKKGIYVVNLVAPGYTKTTKLIVK